MANINFVPEDYVQNNVSRKTNIIFLLLFAVVMIALFISFTTIKIRQRACVIKEKMVNTKMSEIKDAIQRFEELQAKRGEMMRTALTTSQLIEPVPRSVLLASLTNNLPQGVSLIKLAVIQKENRQNTQAASTSKYKAKQAQKAEADKTAASVEKLLETNIDIEGIAPSDLQVAEYIERLSKSSLLNNVSLVESKEHEVKEGTKLRRFKLTAMLQKEVQLTHDDVKKIREEAESAMWNF